MSQTGARGLRELVPGATLPDLRWSDHSGNPRRLSDLVAGDPAVVQFYRGWWCPKEQAFFRRLVDLQDDAEVAYSRIVSISVDPPETAAAFRAGLGARWTFLCDPDREHLEDLGLREVADTTHRPYLPFVAVVDPDLTIAEAWNGYWFWGRPTMDELRLALRAVSARIRPDWTPAGA